jgi:hypothetical protein
MSDVNAATDASTTATAAPVDPAAPVDVAPDPSVQVPAYIPPALGPTPIAHDARHKAHPECGIDICPEVRQCVTYGCQNPGP